MTGFISFPAHRGQRNNQTQQFSGAVITQWSLLFKDNTIVLDTRLLHRRSGVQSQSRFFRDGGGELEKAARTTLSDWLMYLMLRPSDKRTKTRIFFHSELFSSPLWCNGWIPACLPVEGYGFDSLKSLASGRAFFFSAFGSEMLA